VVSWKRSLEMVTPSRSMTTFQPVSTIVQCPFCLLMGKEASVTRDLVVTRRPSRATFPGVRMMCRRRSSSGAPSPQHIFWFAQLRV
jgi:hypothetical protein